MNFPIGPKNLIDFAPHRWQIPLHLLEGIFISELQSGGELTPPERFADSALAKVPSLLPVRNPENLG